MIGYGAWARYPRCTAATAINPLVVELIRGNPRVRETERRRRANARAEQDARRRRMRGYVGNAHEVATAVRLGLRARGYSHAAQEYGAHLVAHGNRHNFQGQFRLAELTGVRRRSVQRYRARLEADGLIESQTLRPGDMLDEMRAPVTRIQVVRNVTGLIEMAKHEPRQREQREQPEQREQRPQREQRVPAGCPAVIDPAQIDQWDRTTAEMQARYEASRRTPAATMEAFAETLGPLPPRRGAPLTVSEPPRTPRRPITEAEPLVPPEPPPVDESELGAIDRERAALESYEAWQRGQPPPD